MFTAMPSLCEIENPRQYVLEKLARFVMAYGAEAYVYNLGTLQGELEWFAARGRLWLISVQGTLSGIGTGIRIAQPEVADQDDWYEQETDYGKYFYVRLFVIHPDYRKFGISKTMIELIRSQFGGVYYLVWHTRTMRLVVRKISSMLGKRGKR